MQLIAIVKMWHCIRALESAVALDHMLWTTISQKNADPQLNFFPFCHLMELIIQADQKHISLSDE